MTGFACVLCVALWRRSDGSRSPGSAPSSTGRWSARWTQPDWLGQAFAGLVGLARGAAVWLTFSQLAVIRRVCPHCTAIRALGVATLVGRLKEGRRLGTRYEKLALNFVAFTNLPFMLKYLRVLDSSDRA